MEGYDPKYPYRDTGGSVRGFFVLIIIFFVFLMFISGTMGNVNLTSNSPSPAQAVAPAAIDSASGEPQVITIQESAPTDNSIDITIPVTGGCTNPYAVRTGDMLSQIAVICDTTVAAIRQANPQITDANLIYPGQLLVIPNTFAVQAQPVPVQSEPVVNIPVPVTGLYPLVAAGTGMQVRGIGYPANTLVNVAIGPQSGGGFTIVTSGVTDANGSLTTRIIVPSTSDSQAPWVVVVATTDQPPITAISQPFVIGNP